MWEESRFYGGWRGWDGRKKVVFMVDGGDGMNEESRFYGGWWGWDEGRMSLLWWMAGRGWGRKSF
jgi:hypothetical protein